jgi:hypothetical protein
MYTQTLQLCRIQWMVLLLLIHFFYRHLNSSGSHPIISQLSFLEYDFNAKFHCSVNCLEKQQRPLTSGFFTTAPLTFLWWSDFGTFFVDPRSLLGRGTSHNIETHNILQHSYGLLFPTTSPSTLKPMPHKDLFARSQWR